MERSGWPHRWLGEGKLPAPREVAQFWLPGAAADDWDGGEALLVEEAMAFGGSRRGGTTMGSPSEGTFLTGITYRRPARIALPRMRFADRMAAALVPYRLAMDPMVSPFWTR